MASKKTKRRNKKKGGCNKNKRKTKRQQRGGLIHNISCDANGNNCENKIYDFSKSKKYIEIMPIVSPNNNNLSVFDFIPKNEGGKTMIDLLSGKTDGVNSKNRIEENTFVKTKIDLELEDLYNMIKKPTKYQDIIKNIFLSKPDLLKKTTILRLLFTLYKGESLKDEFVYDLVTGYTKIENMIDKGVSQITLRDHPIFFGLIRGTFKNVYPQNHSANISTNIFKNGLLEDCYRDIGDKDVISFMTVVLDAEKNKFSHIYSPENYDYIRQAILFFVINRSFEDFDLLIKSFGKVITDARTNIEAAVAPAAVGPAVIPGAAPAVIPAPGPIANQGLHAAVMAAIATP